MVSLEELRKYVKTHAVWGATNVSLGLEKRGWSGEVYEEMMLES